MSFAFVDVQISAAETRRHARAKGFHRRVYRSAMLDKRVIQLGEVMVKLLLFREALPNPDANCSGIRYGYYL